MSRELNRAKAMNLLIFYSTVVSICILLAMKWLEISKDYPKDLFCITCPSLPMPTYPRHIENNINFNLFMFLDFSSLMMIVLIFGSPEYYKHPTYVFMFHVARFMFNATQFSTSEIVERVLRPLFQNQCLFARHCVDRSALPHVTVGLMFLMYFAIMMTNFGIAIVLLMCYDPYAEDRVSPIIVRAPAQMSRGRPFYRFDMSSPFATPPYSSYNRSPSPSKMVVIPTSGQTKYHRLDSCDSFTPPRHSKNKVLPLYMPETQHQIVN